jgi:hypothetical protein
VGVGFGNCKADTRRTCTARPRIDFCDRGHTGMAMSWAMKPKFDDIRIYPWPRPLTRQRQHDCFSNTTLRCGAAARHRS